MQREELEEFKKKLKELIAECGIENASFAGSIIADDEYIGLLGIDADNPGKAFEATCNVGRLWQHSRNAMRQILNDYEKSL